MTSNIERGKLMGQRGDAAGAEAVLWREWAKEPEAAQTAWALRELYSRFPSVAAKRAGPATHLLAVDGRGERVAFNAEVGRVVQHTAAALGAGLRLAAAGGRASPPGPSRGVAAPTALR